MKNLIISFISLGLSFSLIGGTSLSAKENEIVSNDPPIIVDLDYYEDSEKTVKTYLITNLSKEDEKVVETVYANGDTRSEIFSTNDELLNVVTTENGYLTITENGIIVESIEINLDDELNLDDEISLRSTSDWVSSQWVTYNGNIKVNKLAVGAIAIVLSAAVPGSTPKVLISLANLVFQSGADNVYTKRSQRTRISLKLGQQVTFGTTFFYTNSSRNSSSLIGSRAFEVTEYF